jgi:hypothetical protein
MKTASLLAVGMMLAASPASAEDAAPLTEAERSTIGYDSVPEALAALKAKPGVEISDEDGWTIIADGLALWSFTPEAHPAHPSAVKREVVERDGKTVIEMAVLCQSAKAPCDQLVREFTELNENMRRQLTEEGAGAPAASNPRDAEIEAFATNWLDLLEHGEADKSYAFLTDIFKSNLTINDWRTTLAETKERLGTLRSRRLRRIVWYEDPPEAPMPGTYIAVEFDSVYEKAPRHFRYLVLHTQGDEPLRVMRDESTIGETPDQR